VSSALAVAPASRRPPRSRPYVIERRDQIAALESSVRQEVIDTIQAAGPRSALEIASLMGRPADALYYHIRRLQSVGLLVVSETRRRGRRDEAVYDLVGRPLKLRYPEHRDARTHPLMRLVRSMLRTAERDFRGGLLSDGARADGPRRTLWASRRHAWLTPTELQRLNRTIDALIDILTRSRDPKRGQLCTLTLVLAPRVARSGRRGRQRPADRVADE
jgi:predicted ArsR family transcriptional regulator